MLAISGFFFNLILKPETFRTNALTYRLWETRVPKGTENDEWTVVTFIRHISEGMRLFVK